MENPFRINDESRHFLNLTAEEDSRLVAIALNTEITPVNVTSSYLIDEAGRSFYRLSASVPDDLTGERLDITLNLYSEGAGHCTGFDDTGTLFVFSVYIPQTVDYLRSIGIVWPLWAGETASPVDTSSAAGRIQGLIEKEHSILDVPVSSLGLSTRLFHLLKFNFSSGGPFTLREALENGLSVASFISCRNAGKKSLNELEILFTGAGLRLP